MCTHAFRLVKRHARMCAQIFMKNLVNISYYLMNISMKFHKDLSFCCGDILQNGTDFQESINSQCIFYIFTVTPLKSLQRWVITERSLNFLETSYQNVHM